MDDLTDIELVKLALENNERAFECLLERHYMTIYKFAYKWCGIKEDAEDITQDVCVKLARKLDSFRMDSAFTSWLYRVVVNSAKDYYKSKNRKKHNERAFAEEHGLSKDATQIDKVATREVYREINNLPEKLKEAVLLVIDEGLSHKEAALVLNCAENTVSWRIHKAKKKLAKVMG